MASLLFGSLELLASPYVTMLGSDFGAPQPITSATSSLFLDGAVVSGDATGNREVRLMVAVVAESRTALTSACEALAEQVNATSNTLTWTPDGGPGPVWDATAGVYVDDQPVSMVFETFRGSLVPSAFDPGIESSQFVRRYEVSVPALPFARSTTRRTPRAAAATTVVADFDSGESWPHARFAGISTAETALGYLQGDTNLITGDTFLPNASVGTWTVASGSATLAAGSTATYSGYTVTSQGLVITANATGDIELVCGYFPITGGIPHGARAIARTGPADTVRQRQLGIEWADASGTSLGTSWGSVSTAENVSTDQNRDEATVFVYADAPAAATQARLRQRLFAVPSGEVHRSKGHLLQAGLSVYANTQIAGYDGAGVLSVLTYKNNTGTYDQMGFFLHRLGFKSASVDMSGAQNLFYRFYVPFSYNYSGAYAAKNALTLRDGVGRESDFTVTVDGAGASVPTGWRIARIDLTAPTATRGGGADLADVESWDLYFMSQVSNSTGATATTEVFGVDTVRIGPAPAPTTSPRGSVIALDDILGSARSPATVKVTGPSAMTDFLVLATPDAVPPLLTVTSSSATADAPAAYDGVYSIIGCLAPAVSLSSPQVTVTQKIGGTTVATKTLTGAARNGNHYVDFGTVEMPLVPVPDENAQVSYTFALSPSSASWTEVLVVDVDGSLAWVDSLTTSRQYAWIDEPDPTTGVGEVWVGTVADRSDARGLTNAPTLSKPLQVKAPSTSLLVYSTTGAPSVELSYYPRWLTEPTA